MEQATFNGWAVIYALAPDDIRLVTGCQDEAEAKDLAAKAKAGYGEVLFVGEASELLKRFWTGRKSN